MPDPNKKSFPSCHFIIEALSWPGKESRDELKMEQERILGGLFVGVLVLGTLALVISFLLAFSEEKWVLSATIVLVYFWVVYLFVRRKQLSREKLALHFLVFAYLLGWVVLFLAGPLRSGLLYLFAFQIMAAGLFGGKAARVALFLNLFALLAVGLAASLGYLSWTVPPEHRVFRWAVICTNFLFITGVASVLIVSRNKGMLTALEREKGSAAKLRLETEERKAANRALKDREKQYRHLVENINEVVFSLDARGHFTYVSPRIQSLIGYEAEDVLETPLSKLVHEQDLEAFPSWLEKAFSGEKATLIFQVIKKDGEICWVSSTLSPIQGDGEISMALGLLTDVTAEKAAQAEKLALESRLAQAQKMEAIGRLAGGIAHDFNNLMSPILGYSEMMLQDFADNKQVQENLSEVVMAANRAKELVRQILIFGSRAEEHPRPVELGSIIQDALKLVRASVPSTIAVSFMKEPTRFVVNADPTQVQRVVMNLCSNAAHAMQNKDGRLDIVLKRATVGQGYSPMGCELAPGSYARLTIKDNGHGMSPEILNQIFEPYFTTKEVGEGSGIGLAVAHSVVSKLGGSIEVTSNSGKGTCFCTYLPIIENAPDLENEVLAEPLPKGSGRILLVDDESTLVNMTRQMLSRLGYQVTTVNNGLEALDILHAAEGNYDLIITDLTMPGLTGDKLALVVKDKWPGLPVILSTGYTEALTGKKAEQLGMAAILSKPVDMQQMARTVSDVLNKK